MFALAGSLFHSECSSAEKYIFSFFRGVQEGNGARGSASGSGVGSSVVAAARRFKRG